MSIINTKKTKEYYNHIVKNYEKISQKNITYLKTIDNLILKFLKNKIIINLLDIGTGNGIRFKKIRKKIKIKKYFLIEQSKNFYRELEKKFPKSKIANVDFLKYKTNKKYTHIFALWNVIGHVSDINLFFKKINNILSDDGLFFFDFNNKYNIKNYGIKSVLQNLLKDIFKYQNRGIFKLKFKNIQTNVKIFSKSEILITLKKNNLKPIQINYVNYQTGFLEKKHFYGQVFIICKRRKNSKLVS